MENEEAEMKSKFNKSLATVLTCVTLSFGASAVQSATISLIPTSSTTINISDVVTFDLYLDATDLAELLGGGLDVFYDASILTYNGDFAFDAGIPNEGFNFVGDDCAVTLTANCSGPGEINAITFGSFAGLTVGSGYLVGSLSFTGAAEGISVLSMLDNDLPSGPFTNLFGTPIDPGMMYAGATVVVSAVPVPAAVWLFGSGLLGLVGVARRRNAA
jgi:hypothetical protein